MLAGLPILTLTDIATDITTFRALSSFFDCHWSCFPLPPQLHSCSHNLDGSPPLKLAKWIVSLKKIHGKIPAMTSISAKLQAGCHHICNSVNFSKFLRKDLRGSLDRPIREYFDSNPPIRRFFRRNPQLSPLYQKRNTKTATKLRSSKYMLYKNQVHITAVM